MSEPPRFTFGPLYAPDEPSDLALDRLVAGELSVVERAAVERQIAASPEARARLAARREGFAATFPKEAVLARILAQVEGKTAHPALVSKLEEAALRSAQSAHASTGSEPRRGFRAWFGQRWLTVLGTASVAALATLVVVKTTTSGADHGTDSPDDVRAKGGVGLTIHRQTATGSEVVLSGAEFRVGDKLRFEFEAPNVGFGMVVDLDPAGALGPAWPLATAGNAGPVDAGKTLLPGAVALDGSVGTEWLVAVYCPTPFAISDLQLGGAGSAPGSITAPAGCATTAFELRKVAQ